MSVSNYKPDPERLICPVCKVTLDGDTCDVHGVSGVSARSDLAKQIELREDRHSPGYIQRRRAENKHQHNSDENITHQKRPSPQTF